MAIDFNNAEAQREGGLIPEGTIAPVHMTVRPGNAGEGGWLKRSKSGESMALDVEFTVVEGPFAKRKFWGLFTLEGTTDGPPEGGGYFGIAAARHPRKRPGIRPDDESEAAKAGRRMNSLGRLRRDPVYCQDRHREGQGGEWLQGQELALRRRSRPIARRGSRSSRSRRRPPAAATFAPIGVAAAAVAEKAGNGVKKPAWAS